MKRYFLLPVFLAATAVAQTGGQTAAGNNYLANLLHQGQLSGGMILAGLAVAFVLGAIHAMSPGHGKTIVAAYLVGSRGSARHAIFLGGMVTFTHTISVFLLGLGTLFLSRYILPEKIVPVLGVLSGVSIVWIGGILLYKRIQTALHLAHQHHHHDHARAHAHTPVHEHSHAHAHAHEHHHHHGYAHAHEQGHIEHHHHEHNPLVHDHGDGHVHSHVPEGDVSMGSLIALGASGGLVPCPSALVLLLSAIALGRVGLGLGLLLTFSLGLAGVLMAIGLIVLYAKQLLPDSQKASRHAAFRLIPVASAAVIVCVGLIMTAAALGIIRPDQFLAGI
ncbi:MAG TPA: sulfite exporter TauE/SafE family protein [Bryobacteraceae bacterium]|nr:sulfite exporter TauE/SafE family protein [Bryobacteraceae bacterium]